MSDPAKVKTSAMTRLLPYKNRAYGIKCKRILWQSTEHVAADGGRVRVRICVWARGVHGFQWGERDPERTSTL